MAKTVLLVIDLQRGNFEGEGPVHNGEDLLRRANLLIERARAADVPVVFVRHGGPKGAIDEPGAPGWQLHPALEVSADDVVVDKSFPDAFQETTLEDELKWLGAERLVVAGLQTEFCVDTTCRRAFSLGYEVTLVSDAHGTWDGGPLSAEQIIAHHNGVLGGWFVTLAKADEVAF